MASDKTKRTKSKRKQSRIDYHEPRAVSVPKAKSEIKWPSDLTDAQKRLIASRHIETLFQICDAVKGLSEEGAEVVLREQFPECHLSGHYMIDGEPAIFRAFEPDFMGSDG